MDWSINGGNMKNTGNELETERLILRHFTSDDVGVYHTILGDDEVGKWLPKGEGYTLDEVEGWIEKIRRHWEKHGFGVWALMRRDNGTFIGSCGLRILEETGEVEVLYEIARGEWGKGYATEASRAAVEFGFEVVGLEKIIGLTKPKNVASYRVLEKAGLRFCREAEYFGFVCRYYSIIRNDDRGGSGKAR